MKIKTVRVTARQLFNNPFEGYSNYTCEVTLEAALTPGDICDAVVKKLQIDADYYVAQHRQQFIDKLTTIRAAIEEKPANATSDLPF